MKKDTIDIGHGRFSGKYFDKESQLIRIGEWYALKTSERWDMEKLIVGKLDTTEKWKEYIFCADSIENSAMWQREKINSSPHNGASEVRIISLDQKGEILVEYDYAIRGRLFPFNTGDRELIYRIDKKTGLTYLVKIVEE